MGALAFCTWIFTWTSQLKEECVSALFLVLGKEHKLWRSCELSKTTRRGRSQRLNGLCTGSSPLPQSFQKDRKRQIQRPCCDGKATHSV